MPLPFDNLGVTNTYIRRARLQPALIVALPVAVATLAFFPSGLVGWGTVWGAFVLCGGTALLAQVARDRGKIKEKGLFASWNGKPSVRLLRHHGSANKIVLARRHGVLQQLIGSTRIPNSTEEASDPVAADHVYDACTAILIDQTRKKADFPLVFEENCNYGFRRNLWGMKPIGLPTSVAGASSIIALLVTNYLHGLAFDPLAATCFVVDLLLLLGWLAWFTPNWVRIAAEAYAERLLESCEAIRRAALVEPPAQT